MQNRKVCNVFQDNTKQHTYSKLIQTNTKHGPRRSDGNFPSERRCRISLSFSVRGLTIAHLTPDNARVTEQRMENGSRHSDGKFPSERCERIPLRASVCAGSSLLMLYQTMNAQVAEQRMESGSRHSDGNFPSERRERFSRMCSAPRSGL